MSATVSKRYAVAIVSTSLALLLNLWLPADLRQYSVFFAAVAVSSWYGGLGPGMAAAFTAMIAEGALTLAPSWQLTQLGPSELTRGAVFVLVAALIGRLTESLRVEREVARTEADRAVESQMALRLEKRRTETILESVSDGITVQNAAGGLIFANEAAWRLLGRVAASDGTSPDAGDPFASLDLRGEDGRPLPPEALPSERALAGEDAPETIVSYRLPGSGGERWALVRARAIRDPEGRIVMAVSALHDLTQRIRHERALEENARELQALTHRLEATVDALRVERSGAVTARAEAESALERVITLQRLTNALSEALTPEEVAAVVLERGAQAVGALRGVLVAFRASGDGVEVLGTLGIDASRISSWSEGNDSALPSAEDLRVALGTEHLSIVPVATRDHPLGVLAFDLSERERDTLEPRERDLMVALGRQCAQALDRARLYAEERTARAEAEQASRAKSQFLALMSHELRTPLNAVLGYEELLETEISGPITAVQRQHLSRIRESTRHLLALIEQILSLSRVQAGREALQLEDIDAVVLVSEAASLVEPQLRRKGVALELDVPAAAELRTDGRKLRQILLNVLSNAVKFTERGTVRVVLERATNALLITVRDTGRGIDAAHREQIFEPFVQLSGEGALPTGAGLGLAVARELARHLGGDVTLESRRGEGSTFTIRIPAEEMEAAPAPEPDIEADAELMGGAEAAPLLPPLPLADDGDGFDGCVDA